MKQTDVVVIGAGPGGYAAAFCAADQGHQVILIEKRKRLGGVCLNQGCIPSKALLHVAKLIKEAKDSENRGVSFSEPKIDLEKMRHWKNCIIEKLSQGVQFVASKRNVEVICGEAHFENSTTVSIKTEEGDRQINFKKAIIATGSKPALPSVFDLGSPHIMTSTEALELNDIPKDLLVIGGGYIGMELGTVYSALGSNVVVVEALSGILTGADPDLARYVLNYAQENFKDIRLSTKVASMSLEGDKVKVAFEGSGELKEELYDKVLVSVGRVPNSEGLGLENTQVQKTDTGFIQVNNQQQTQDPNIYAIGDVSGGVLLAHKASKEARIAVGALSGNEGSNEFLIPAVVFTDPEVAWVGLTHEEAKEKDIPVNVARFPWAASGRANSFDRPDGLTKLIIEPETDKILGVGIAGHGAGELIAEGVLAVEKGLIARDLAEIVHPHPTLSETLKECAEAYYDECTHVAPRNRNKRPID